MFDIGFGELMVVAVVALIVLGPERLPAVAKSAGRLIAKCRSQLSDLQQELEKK